MTHIWTIGRVGAVTNDDGTEYMIELFDGDIEPFAAIGSAEMLVKNYGREGAIMELGDELLEKAMGNVKPFVVVVGRHDYSPPDAHDDPPREA